MNTKLIAFLLFITIIIFFGEHNYLRQGFSDLASSNPQVITVAIFLIGGILIYSYLKQRIKLK